MNVLQELAESYTYNGSVSLKAIEDDIVTLENQIESFNATLKEVNLRHKNPAPLVQRIRDAKIRLTLLKALYKKESERDTSNDAIMDMLGVSGKEAKEIESPDTAVANREPKQQNFESSELEKQDNEVVEDVEAVKHEDTDDVDVVERVKSEKQNDKDMNVFRFDEINTADRAIIVRELNLNKEDDKKVQKVEEESERENIVPPLTIDDYEEPLENVKKDFSIDPETGEVVINVESFTNPVEYFIPAKDQEAINPCADCDVVTCPSNKQCVYDYTIFTEPMEQQENETSITMGDKPEETKDLSSVEEEKTEEGDGTLDANYPIVDCEFESEAELSGHDYPVMDMFYESDLAVYASYDLSRLTNMVNTNSVNGFWNSSGNELHIEFDDIKDYTIFVKLLNEHYDTGFLNKLLKKRNSIFMTVHQKIGEEVKHITYEFTKCRPVTFSETRYASQKEADTYPAPAHNFWIDFKYKKLKITQ